MKKIAVVLVTMSILAVALAMFARHVYVLPVLMYHSINQNENTTKLSVSPEGFEKQMKFLHDFKYNVVGPEKIAAYLNKEERIPPRTVAITFDDGFYNNYKYAYPILKKYGLPATIFVITDKIGEDGFLNWDQLREMADSGLITIGSHTMSHCWLPDANDARLAEELSGSKRALEEGLGKKVEYLCYPLGAHDDRVEEASRNAGYRVCFATNPGPGKPSDNVFAVKRIRVSRTSNNLLVFWFESSGYYTWVKEHRDK